MPLDAIRIDEEDFCFDTLDVIARSFQVSLPKDLGHIHTAGDLFDEILSLRPASATGEKCDSAMVFFRLRSTFARLNPEMRITPSTRLADLTRMSANQLSKRLARDTELEMPIVPLGNPGCAALVLGLIGAPLMWWLVDVRAFAALGVTSFLLMMADRGRYWDDWDTVWSLTDAIARKNVARLSAMGARNRPEDWWRRYAEILAHAAQPLPNGARLVDARLIGRETRFELV